MLFLQGVSGLSAWDEGFPARVELGRGSAKRRDLRSGSYDENRAPNINCVSGQLLSTRRTTVATRVLRCKRGSPEVWNVISKRESTSSKSFPENRTPDWLILTVSPRDQSSLPCSR